FAALAAGIAGADPERNAAADNAGGRNEAKIRIAQVNGPAAPAVETRGTAEDLRHRAAGIGAACQHMTVVTVGRGGAVARLEQRYQRNPGRFLADIKVIVANELLFVGKPQHRLLEPAYQQHLFEKGPGKLIAQGHESASRSKIVQRAFSRLRRG